jgi:hypothetical protein
MGVISFKLVTVFLFCGMPVCLYAGNKDNFTLITILFVSFARGI